MAMSEVWTLPDEALARIDISGFKVVARDGTIGRVAQAFETSGGGHFVVEPGVAMPLGRQLIVPAGLVERVEIDDQRVFVRAGKEQIKNAPEFDETRPLDDQSRSALGDYFHGLMEDLTGRASEPKRQRNAPTRGSSKRTPTSRARRSSARRQSSARGSDSPTKEELYDQARRLDIKGRSKMNKAALARAVGRRRGQSGRSRSTPARQATPVEVQAFLEGVGYPTGKRQLLREAEQQQASRGVRTTLRRLPDKQFKSPTEVSKAIGRL
jgi:hypothetical protein